jgi:hypothetical protein
MYKKMTDAEWGKLCSEAWERAAEDLMARGFERHDLPGQIVPAYFTKGERKMYLARQLGVPVWYPRLWDLT